jgi:hypothetical protein
MNVILGKKISLELSNIVDMLLLNAKENLYFIPFNAEATIITSIFDIIGSFNNVNMIDFPKNIKMKSFTDFYNMERNIDFNTINNNAQFVVVVVSPHNKKNAGISYTFHTLNEFLPSLPSTNCTTIFIEGNFLQIHEIECFIREKIISKFEKLKKGN